MMSYQETLSYLFAKLPMFTKIGGAAFKPSLDNTIQLCQALDNPQQKFKSIHIAGTNGKGSTSHQLAAILQKQGYKVGLYTSPHLKDFRERIKVDGKMCEESFVVEFVENIKPLIAEISPSFFEVTVAMAFEYFAQQEVNIAVIEVGMGGRLDSTNIILPVLSIITNIGFDHVQFLGNTYEAIASEKAGIIKKEIPVIIGEYNSETLIVFNRIAATNNCDIYLAQDNWKVKNVDVQLQHQTISIESEQHQKKYQFELDLLGSYQQKNIKQVLESCVRLNLLGIEISDESIISGLKVCKRLTGFWGRWDVIHQQPTIIVDVAHNEDGINQVLQQLSTIKSNHLHFVIGMVKDKDIQKVLQLLPQKSSYYFTNAAIERALPSNELRALANAINLQGNSYKNVNEAIDEALKIASKDDTIIVCGSIFLVAEINKFNYMQITS